ncbi:gamma-glutamylcyclotransferase family protein [Aureimonas glaciei]|uniref:Gamma-glutamylcyclotransferase AIG2-like domain-containing protein n=1 Tax=Aureimonas glaciei TaxID=1776957 RepID=A0A916XWX1_9HYPH|nr:gamma-glutamylcyclotransferase family protein [Aureimonas glaciei]GGD17941.1 hypothetical protein GCM10011335_20930 [Aureimonas glaciei]
MDIHEDHPDFHQLAEAGQVVAYFGYGSLVNRATLRTKFLAIRRAEVSGWRRFWLPRSETGIALLSARPDPGHATQGVVVYDHADHLAAVDEREAGYIRRDVDGAGLVVDAAPAAAPVHIYEAISPGATAAETGALILQSYLDAVLQGFLSLYGRAGVERFVAETQGFETGIVQDRMTPRYPRSVKLGAGEAEFFDRLVIARGAHFRPAD